MSNNCLKTTLNVVSENEYLPRLNQLSFYSKEGETVNVTVSSKATARVKLYAINGTIYNGSTVVQSPTELATVDGRPAYPRSVVLNPGGRAYIENKYDLTVIGFPCDFSEIKACKELLGISNYTISSAGNNTRMTGNLADLAGLTKLEKCQIVYLDNQDKDTIYGDIKVFANMPNLSVLRFARCTAVYGKIEDVLAGIINSGRTSATTKADGIEWENSIDNNTNITFGNLTTFSVGSYFVWEPSANANEYVVTCKKTSDNTTILSETIHVNSNGSWSIVS